MSIEPRSSTPRAWDANWNRTIPGSPPAIWAKGSSKLALYSREDSAAEAGVSAEGSGFPGVSLHYLTDSREAVDEVMQTAAAVGATIVEAAAPAEWGGYFGYFADPDGYLWKAATAS